jgi:hypothetical protein
MGLSGEVGRNLKEVETFVELREVPKEEAAVETIGALGDR